MSSRALIRPTRFRAQSLKTLWAARILSSVPLLVLLFDGFTKLLNGPAIREAHERLEYPVHLAPSLGLVVVACAVLYAMPRTSLLGAVLLTGYLGGATATLVRVGEPCYFPVVVGVLLWAGLYLRDERLRALLAERDDAEA